MDPEIANRALSMAMAWGEQYVNPTQPRLAQLYPSATPNELDEYDRLAHEAIETGNNYVQMYSNATYEAFGLKMRPLYPWASEDNLDRLYSQSVYYSRK